MTKSELARADLLFLKTAGSGVCIEGSLFPFSIVSGIKSLTPISFQKVKLLLSLPLTKTFSLPSVNSAFSFSHREFVKRSSQFIKNCPFNGNF